LRLLPTLIYRSFSLVGTMGTRFDRRIRDGLLDFNRQGFGLINIHDAWIMMRFSRRPDSRNSGGYIYIVNSRPFAVLRTLAHLNLTLMRILKGS
jgi:hypothetical protein